MSLPILEAAALAPGLATLEAREVKKAFGHVVALDGVSLTLHRGEVVALLGDNGAGKSTLVALLSGLQQPDSGAILLNGVPTKVASPAQAQRLGIVTVFQDLALVPKRDVASNIFAGREPCRLRFFVDRKRMRREAATQVEELHVSLPSVKTLVSELSGGQRQATALVRCLIMNHPVMLMDEPTAALGVREAAEVLKLVTSLREHGCSILLVSHNMDSVFGVADRVVVLRHGHVLADRGIHDISRQEVVALLTGGFNNGDLG